MINKRYIIMLMTSMLMFSSCLKENPPLLTDDLYESKEGIETALNGIYAGFSDSQYLKQDYFHVANLAGGIYRSSSINDRTTINKLNMPTNHNYVENLWLASYKMIERTNLFISNMAKKEPLTHFEENQLAQAYFLRAFNYFNIVRIWGDAPLRLDPATDEHSTSARATRKDIYTQIIIDAQTSEKLFENSQDFFSQPGRPSVYAINMLLAKVYMTLATADIDNSVYNNPKPEDIIPLTIEAKNVNTNINIKGITLGDSHACWTEAYKEAKKVYDSGKFSLVANFEDLWYENGNNSSESIFEIQMNLQSGYEGKLWTPRGSYKGGQGWSRISFYPEIVKDAWEGDYHLEPRYKSTFLTHYLYYGQFNDDGSPKEEVLFGDSRFMEPADGKIKNRTKKNGYPLLRKYAIKDFEQTTSISNQNMPIYRYADLLLMLAEISNELQNGEQDGYLNEVLDRARKSKVKDLQTGKYIDSDGVHPLAITGLAQNEFREIIMKEYRHELTGEGQDYFTERRRGREWFRTHTVIPHNEYIADGTKPYTVIASEDLRWDAQTDEIALNRAMYAPIPYSEITTNMNISSNDQNDGY